VTTNLYSLHRSLATEMRRVTPNSCSYSKRTDSCSSLSRFRLFLNSEQCCPTLHFPNISSSGISSATLINSKIFSNSKYSSFNCLLSPQHLPCLRESHHLIGYVPIGPGDNNFWISYPPMPQCSPSLPRMIVLIWRQTQVPPLLYIPDCPRTLRAWAVLWLKWSNPCPCSRYNREGIFSVLINPPRDSTEAPDVVVIREESKGSDALRDFVLPVVLISSFLFRKSQVFVCPKYFHRGERQCSFLWQQDPEQ